MDHKTTGGGASVPHQSVELTTALVFFFLSGFSALIYEVAWLSRIQLVMGHTVYSLATTLCAYLSGLALGSYVAGRLLKGELPGLTLYITAEALVGVYGIVFTAILATAVRPYGWLVSAVQLPLPLLSAVQFVVCATVIFIPTTLMGMTLPFMTQAFADRGVQVDQALPKLYALNTLGAFMGCLTTGFILLPTLGYKKAIIAAAAINVGILVAAAFLFTESHHFPSPSEWRLFFKKVRGARFGTITLDSPKKAAALTLFYSGAASMAIQILWNRITALVFGPSTYVFPLVTAVVLVGIVAGAMLARRALKSPQLHRDLILTALPALTGLTLLVANLAFTQTPLLVLSMYQFMQPGFWLLSGVQFTIMLTCCFVPAALLGALFPLATTRVTSNVHQDEAASVVGFSAAVNIVGLIFGAVLCSFILIPYFGIENLHYLLVSTLFILTAVLCVWLVRRPMAAVATLVFAALLLTLAPRFDWNVLTAGHFYNRSPRIEKERLAQLGYLNIHDFSEGNSTILINHRDDPHATVSIHQSRTNRNEVSFKINGKVDGNNTSDLQTTRFVAWLPTLLKPDAQSSLTIGLGTGNTVGETLRYPDMQRASVVELSAAMVDFAQRYFFLVSNGFWSDKRASVHVRDGRDYLAHSKETYDIILSEPSNPWVEGVGSLFTVEYYTALSKRLAPGGVASLWFHTYGLDCLAVKSVLAAASQVFKTIHVFKLGADLYMIASAQKEAAPAAGLSVLPVGMGVLERDLLELAGVNMPVGQTGAALVEAYNLFGHNTYVFDTWGLQNYVEGATPNTDDNQLLQFSAGRSYYTGVSCKSIAAEPRKMKFNTRGREAPQDLASPVGGRGLASPKN